MNKKNWIQKVTDSVEEFFLKIFSIIGLKKFVVWYRKNQEAMRYLVFGGLSTVVNIVVFVLMEMMKLSTLTSNTIAWVAAVIFAYITNKLCVFNSVSKDKNDLLREIGSFFGCRLLTLVIDEAYMYFTIDIMHFNSILMKIISNIIVIILNYIFSKVLIFKKK